MTKPFVHAPAPSIMRRARWWWSDLMQMTWRNLIHYVRLPYLIFFAVIQPILFTLLFVYVFGGEINTGGGKYVDYFIPGIIIQTAIFSSMGSGINIAADTEKGVMDRFRSLPMSRGTVLAARTLSDTVRNFLGSLIMVAVGFGLGYRFHGTFMSALGGLGIAVLIGFAFSWIAAAIGLAVRDVQTAEIAGFTWVFPVTFLSSIFVPTEHMPKWLQAFANNNPVSLAANAARHFSNPAYAGSGDWLWAVIWCAGIIIVFRTLSVLKFNRLQ